VTGYKDNLACVEVCNSFPKWGRRDQKRKFVFADNKIILMMTALAASANKFICWTEGERERERKGEREKLSANAASV
jgi:uncharacterized protein YbcI